MENVLKHYSCKCRVFPTFDTMAWPGGAQLKMNEFQYFGDLLLTMDTRYKAKLQFLTESLDCFRFRSNEGAFIWLCGNLSKLKREYQNTFSLYLENVKPRNESIHSVCTLIKSGLQNKHCQLNAYFLMDDLSLNDPQKISFYNYEDFGIFHLILDLHDQDHASSLREDMNDWNNHGKKNRLSFEARVKKMSNSLRARNKNSDINETIWRFGHPLYQNVISRSFKCHTVQFELRAELHDIRNKGVCLVWARLHEIK